MGIFSKLGSAAKNVAKASGALAVNSVKSLGDYAVNGLPGDIFGVIRECGIRPLGVTPENIHKMERIGEMVWGAYKKMLSCHTQLNPVIWWALLFTALAIYLSAVDFVTKFVTNIVAIIAAAITIALVMYGVVRIVVHYGKQVAALRTVMLSTPFILIAIGALSTVSTVLAYSHEWQISMLFAIAPLTLVIHKNADWLVAHRMLPMHLSVGLTTVLTSIVTVARAYERYEAGGPHGIIVLAITSMACRSILIGVSIWFCSLEIKRQVEEAANTAIVFGQTIMAVVPKTAQPPADPQVSAGFVANAFSAFDATFAGLEKIEVLCRALVDANSLLNTNWYFYWIVAVRGMVVSLITAILWHKFGPVWVTFQVGATLACQAYEASVRFELPLWITIAAKTSLSVTDSEIKWTDTELEFWGTMLKQLNDSFQNMLKSAIPTTLNILREFRNSKNASTPTKRVLRTGLRVAEQEGKLDEVIDHCVDRFVPQIVTNTFSDAFGFVYWNTFNAGFRLFENAAIAVVGGQPIPLQRAPLYDLFSEPRNTPLLQPAADQL